MLALLAAIAFLIGLIFKVASVDSGDFDAIALIALGLTLLALHFVWPVGVWHRDVRGPRP